MQPLSAQPFTPNSSVNDILTQPTFQGFAERLLPWDDNSNEPNLQLNQIEQLMPYHSHISPQVVTDTLNKMVIRAEQGERIFTTSTPKRKNAKLQASSVQAYLCLKANRMRPLR